MRTFTLLIAALLLGGCGAPRIDITADYGTLDIGGDLGVATGPIAGKANVNSAGLDSDSSVPGATAEFIWGGSHLAVSGFSSGFSGNGIMDATITSGGNTITAGTPVASSMDLAAYSGVYTFDFVPSDLIDVGIGLGATYLDMQAQLVDQTTMTVIEGSQGIPVPVLAARLGTRIWRLDASLNAQGIALSTGSDSLSYYNVDLMAKFNLIGGDEHLAGSLALGYRWIGLDAEYDNDEGSKVDGSLDFTGPYIGLTLSI